MSPSTTDQEGTPGTMAEDVSQLRDLLVLYVPGGFRDEDGAWHDGPHRAAALKTLDRMAVRCDQQERRAQSLKDALTEIAKLGAKNSLRTRIARAALAETEPVTTCLACGTQAVRPHGGGFKCRHCGALAETETPA